MLVLYSTFKITTAIAIKYICKYFYSSNLRITIAIAVVLLSMLRPQARKRHGPYCGGHLSRTRNHEPRPNLAVAGEHRSRDTRSMQSPICAEKRE